MTNEEFAARFEEEVGHKVGAQYNTYTPAQARQYYCDRERLDYPNWCKDNSSAKIGDVVVVNRHNKIEAAYWTPVMVDGDVVGWENRPGNGCRFDGI